MDKFYIAYGSNMNLAQMALRCPDSKVISPAMLQGYELQFKFHATIEPNPESEVPVLLWKISEQDEKNLDRYEGFPKYYRKEVTQFDFKGKKVDGMVYIMNGNSPLQAPSDGYYETILQGYKAFGLDEKFLENALQKSIDFGYSEDFQMKF